MCIVCECVCVGQVQLDNLEQLAGIDTEEQGPETRTLRNTKWQGTTIRSLSIYQLQLADFQVSVSENQTGRFL